jgi:hypothetical protein
MVERSSLLGAERIGSTMSSSNFDGSSDPRVRIIELTTQQFEAIFQIVHQLRNFPESRLVGLGITATDLDCLIGSFGWINDHLGGHSRVQIDVSSIDSDGSPAAPVHLIGQIRDSQSIDALCGVLPQRIAARLRSVAEMVSSSLGPRELFLRTGYTFDEIREAARAISKSG